MKSPEHRTHRRQSAAPGWRGPASSVCVARGISVMAKSSASKSARRVPPTKPTPVEPTDVEIDLEVEREPARPAGAKNIQAKAIRETEVLESVAGLNLDSVSTTLASTQVEVQKSLADLSA